MYKEKDIEIYQIIKQWEDNFTLKQQQLSFLFSLLLNKLYKNFRELIEKDKNLFDGITEITEQADSREQLPLNFALSNILMDKLTEEELNERIKEIHSKIESLDKEINLYRNELSNLKKTLSDKVKIREGITNENVQCSVCRKGFDFSKDQIIKCPFCGAIFHYLCIAFWLGKYNSCPVCQNSFLDPNAGVYIDQ
jgi:rubrerythrin